MKYALVAIVALLGVGCDCGCRVDQAEEKPQTDAPKAAEEKEVSQRAEQAVSPRLAVAADFVRQH